MGKNTFNAEITKAEKRRNNKIQESFDYIQYQNCSREIKSSLCLNGERFGNFPTERRVTKDV